MILNKSRYFFVVIILLSTSAISLGMYQPETGRFIQQDPIGVRDGICLVYFSMTGVPIISGNISFTVQYHDGMNVYQYTQSNPVLLIDIYGLSEEQVCCKINEKHTTIVTPIIIVPYPGYMLPTREITYTTCTQETIPNPKGFSHEGACACHYKYNKNIRVYDSHDGPCCWCDIFYYQQDEFLGHAWFGIKCPKDKGGESAYSIYPWNTPMAIIPHPVDVTVNVVLPNIPPLRTARVSCDVAMKWQAKLNDDWSIYQFPLHHCRDWADNVMFEMKAECP